MSTQGEKHDDDRYHRLERRVADLEAKQTRFQRALRNRPTKRQVNQRFAELSGAATRGQIWVAAIGGAALVIAALISGVVDIYNTPPLPTK